MHPRNLGRDWLRAISNASGLARPDVPALMPSPPRAPAKLQLVPTSEEMRRTLGLLVHRMTRAETAAWNAADPSEREDTRRTIRQAVRELGGGELHDHRGRRLERID